MVVFSHEQNTQERGKPAATQSPIGTTPLKRGRNSQDSQIIHTQTKAQEGLGVMPAFGFDGTFTYIVEAETLEEAEEMLENELGEVLFDWRVERKY